MNTKRWVMAGVAAFGVTFIVDMVVHGKLLMPLYQQTASVWRPQAETNQKMWLMMLGQLFFGLVFAGIYTQGYEAEKSGLGQGLRYGLWIGLLLAISYVSVWYVVLPIPFCLAMGWVGGVLADCLLAGAAVGLIYREG